MKLLPPHYFKHLMSRQFISKIRTLSVVSTLLYHRSYHLRRPRGSQSGREKRRNESFQVLAKEPLGTDSHRAISKTSSGCRILIGHKNCFVLLCPIGEQFLLSSFREFVRHTLEFLNSRRPFWIFMEVTADYSFSDFRFPFPAPPSPFAVLYQ